MWLLGLEKRAGHVGRATDLRLQSWTGRAVQKAGSGSHASAGVALDTCGRAQEVCARHSSRGLLAPRAPRARAGAERQDEEQLQDVLGPEQGKRTRDHVRKAKAAGDAALCQAGNHKRSSRRAGAHDGAPEPRAPVACIALRYVLRRQISPRAAPFGGLSSSEGSAKGCSSSLHLSPRPFKRSGTAHAPWLRSPNQPRAAQHAWAHPTDFHVDCAHRDVTCCFQHPAERRQLDVDLETSVAVVGDFDHSRAAVEEKLEASAHPLCCPGRRRSARARQMGVHSWEMSYAKDFPGG